MENIFGNTIKNFFLLIQEKNRTTDFDDKSTLFFYKDSP